MARVDDINELHFMFQVDNNRVVCQAYQLENGHTKISLITPSDNWTKEFIITTNGVYGYSLKCGDHDGAPMAGLNSNNKYNTVDLGAVTSPIAIQFKKAKFLGIMTDYGTMTLPPTVRGHHIIFFWPKDAPGDHWNHFIDSLQQAKHVSSEVAGISSDVVQIGSGAATLRNMFPH